MCSSDLQNVLRSHSILLQKSTPQIAMSSNTAYKEMQEFWEKNRKLNRPLSPHLSIYKPQLTSMLSLCHRATGIAMSIAVSIVPVVIVCMPHDFTHYVNLIHNSNIPHELITAAKYVLAFPITYHYINGIRHLAWDWATGFSMKATYNSGYFVMALALMVTAIFVNCF